MNWYRPFRETEMEQSLAKAVTRRAGKHGAPTSVVVLHKDRNVQTVEMDIE